MSVQLTPSKRPYDRNTAETNGKGKWQKSANFSSQHSPLKTPSSGNSIRVLCPVSRIGSVIGKGGNAISQIRQETGAKVQVEETVPGCDERVIIIARSGKDNEVDSEQGKVEDGQNGETNEPEKGGHSDEHDKNDKDKKSVEVEHSQREKAYSSVQKALMLVFERMLEEEPETGGGEAGDNKSSSRVLRLIVHSNQVGYLLGKGGSTIKKMCSETGAEICVLPRDKLPSCASSSDDLVQISGEFDTVRKGLESVSRLLLEYPCDQDNQSLNFDRPSSHEFGHSFSRQDTFPQPNRPFRGQGGPPFHSGYRDGEMGFPGQVNPRQDVLSFRLLCPDEKVGGVIGKGGNVIKALQHETGCEIKVLDPVPDSDGRIIVISGQVHPEERISAVQDAVLRVQSKIIRSAPESKEQNITAKILVPSNQIGCLLGKGGSVIAEMRKSTGAYIRILGKEQTPKFAVDNEVVQINGELETVQEALMQITARLRSHFFRDAFPSMHHGPNPSFHDQMAPFPPYMGRQEFSPQGRCHNVGPPFRKFDAISGLPPPRGLHPHDDRPPFMHDFHRPGIPHHVSERMPPPAPWGPQGMMEGGGPMPFPDYPGAPQRRMGGFGGGNHPAVITSTTVEVVVPSSVVPAIYGEDGGCLRQIHEISDAKVTITDSKPGSTETLIIISGTPEQTNAAQSLIQAFVISETEAP